MSVNVFTVSDGINKMFEGMKKREKALQGYLNRNVLEQYRNIQRKRWITENVSEAKPWTRLEKGYAIRKKTRFAAYPGAGNKMLIATGKLYQSVIGPGEGFKKMVTPTKLYLATSVDYAKDVDAKRSFTEYNKRTISQINYGIAQFIFKGILKQTAELV